MEMERGAVVVGVVIAAAAAAAVEWWGSWSRAVVVVVLEGRGCSCSCGRSGLLRWRCRLLVRGGRGPFVVIVVAVVGRTELSGQWDLP